VEIFLAIRLYITEPIPDAHSNPEDGGRMLHMSVSANKTTRCPNPADDTLNCTGYCSSNVVLQFQVTIKMNCQALGCVADNE
jgi:hypothetical protein